MSDNDDTERAGTSARVERGLLPAVPPDAPASRSDADADLSDDESAACSLDQV